MSYHWYIIIAQAVVIVILVASMLVYDCPRCREREERLSKEFAESKCICLTCGHLHPSAGGAL